MDIEHALPRYLAVLDGKEKPVYVLAREKGLLEKKADQAYKILEKCVFCERLCMAHRPEKTGECGASGLRVSTVFPHYGEEPFFVPSYTVFFSACNLHCVFCQNYAISQYHKGYGTSVDHLTSLIDSAPRPGCKNINFVGGSPTPFIPYILDSLNNTTANLPTIWNSNFYMSPTGMNLIKDAIDVYLSDWKYGNDKCAERLSKVSNYSKIVARNHELAFKDAELVIRHLMLPNHFECCTKPILEEIAERFKDKVIVNVMSQYRVAFQARLYPEINRLLSREEHQQALELAESLGLNYCY